MKVFSYLISDILVATGFLEKTLLNYEFSNISYYIHHRQIKKYKSLRRSDTISLPSQTEAPTSQSSVNALLVLLPKN